MEGGRESSPYASEARANRNLGDPRCSRSCHRVSPGAVSRSCTREDAFERPEFVDGASHVLSAEAAAHSKVRRFVTREIQVAREVLARDFLSIDTHSKDLLVLAPRDSVEMPDVVFDWLAPLEPLHGLWHGLEVTPHRTMV